MAAHSDSDNYRNLIDPFSFDRGDNACLLLHGFTGSPSEMMPLGAFLAGQDYSVRCPLLPGHGTSLSDLERYRWQDWFDAAREEWEGMMKRYARVFVIGLSMGGALALHLAAHRQVHGVVALSTGVKLKDWRITALPVLRFFVRRVKKTRNAFARGPERTRYAYNYNSSRATRQIVLFYRHLRDDLPEITAPLLMINARNDRTIPFENTDIIASGVRSALKKIFTVERANHIITLCDGKDVIHREVHQFLSSL